METGGPRMRIHVDSGKLTRHFNSWHRPRDLYGLDLAKLAALLPDVFQDVLVFLLQY